jgi:hypothetical protein
MSIVKSNSGRNFKFTTPPGTPDVQRLNPDETRGKPVTLVVFPGGNTALAEATWSPPSEVAAGTADWLTLGTGIAAPTKFDVWNPTGVRITATGGSVEANLQT